MASGDYDGCPPCYGVGFMIHEEGTPDCEVCEGAGYIPRGYSFCHIHWTKEKITWRTYIVCFECGHVWTARALRKAWLKNARPYWRPRRWRRAREIYSCQECVHDF